MKTSPSKIPTPAHPSKRQSSLPWQSPKESVDDVDTHQRIEQILAHPHYQTADEDTDFLSEPSNRGVRLQLDYTKAEQILQAKGIKQTIVVFGSTRIPEPSMAEKQVKILEKRLEANPYDESLAQKRNVAIRLKDKSGYYEVAREFGKLVSNARSCPQDCHLVVMTGGGPGIMEAASRGAFDTGAKNIGLNITLPHEQYPNPFLSPDLCFSFHYFAIRKMHFLLRAKALVAFPGGYGTFDELFETLTLIQTRKMAPLPVILVGESFWREAVNFEFLVDEGVIDPEDKELFWYAETADEIWQGIQEWHQNNGTPIQCITGK